MPRFNPARAVELLESGKHHGDRRRPRRLPCAPVRDGAPRTRASWMRCRLCICGGAPLSVALQERWFDATGVELRQGYGLTESGPVCLFNHVGQPNAPGSLGTPLPGVEVDLRTPIAVRRRRTACAGHTETRRAATRARSACAATMCFADTSRARARTAASRRLAAHRGSRPPSSRRPNRVYRTHKADVHPEWVQHLSARDRTRRGPDAGRCRSGGARGRRRRPGTGYRARRHGLGDRRRGCSNGAPNACAALQAAVGHYEYSKRRPRSPGCRPSGPIAARPAPPTRGARRRRPDRTGFRHIACSSSIAISSDISVGR